ncbi:MAG: hypothetical protein WBY01_21620, partial [Pseudolabrys sp.]
EAEERQGSRLKWLTGQGECGTTRCPLWVKSRHSQHVRFVPKADMTARHMTLVEPAKLTHRNYPQKSKGRAKHINLLSARQAMSEPEKE